jgi:diguanylate cyclase (GGDEF)-like protein
MSQEPGRLAARPQVVPLEGFGRGWNIFRTVYVMVLLVFGATGVLDFASVGVQRMFLVAGVMALVSPLVMPFANSADRESRLLQRAAWLLLPVDVAAFTALTFATERLEDVVFPLFVGLGLFYVAISEKKRALWISFGIVVAYVFAHTSYWLLYGTTAGGAVLLALKAAAIPLAGYYFADWIEKRADREAELVASRLEVAGLNEELTRRLSELHIVAEITEVIHSSLDFETIGPIVLDSLKKAIDMPTCSLMVIDRKTDETVFHASAGIDQAQTSPPMTGYFPSPDDVLETGEAAPMFTCTNLIEHNDMGVVFCCPADRLEALSDDDMLVLQAIASELVVAVENSRLYQLTKRLSITDELTGLRNYRFFQQRLDQEYERANRYNRYLSLLMLDIDHFKEFNDSHGHITGDRALSDLAGILSVAVREVDVVARYGGEEFGVILPETDAAGAFVVAEKIREAVALYKFADPDGERSEHVTVSIGVATFPIHALDREALLRQADDALYQAKHFGRDRVRAPRITSETTGA